MYFFEEGNVPEGFEQPAVIELSKTPLKNRFIVGKHGTSAEVKRAYFQTLLARLYAKDRNYESILRLINDDTTIVYSIHDKVILDVIEKLWYRLCGSGSYYDNLEELASRYLIDESWIIPENDGIDHINLYSKSKSELGRLLTNFAHTPFNHHLFGEFCSIEGLWYWLLTDRKHDELRKVSGYAAKELGKAFLKEEKLVQVPDDFMQNIKSGILAKVEQNEVVRSLLKENHLPLIHYYTYGDPGNQAIRRPREYDWITTYLELVRCYLQGSAVKLAIAGSRYIPVIEDYFDDLPLLERYYKESGYHAVEIVSGGAHGVDTVAMRLAKKLSIPFRRFPADWDKHKKAAGHIRNVEMAKACTAGLLVWDGSSKGTANMIENLKKLEKPYQVFAIEDNDFLRRGSMALKQSQ